MTSAELAAQLAARAEWRFSRSSGPGGQRRDHAETRAELVVRAEDLEGIPEPLADRVARGLGLDRRPLRLRSETERSRERNREIVLGRLEARVAAALAPPPPPRRPTAPTRAAKARRLEEKAQRGAVKAKRQRPALDD
ncbi:MAG: ribosome-associated protein [Miltoncostaeaceae bacterium]|jgi:ribosome-associated protein|nr:ribosome-associated protein [Miltoncostaeaceae bacterium]